MLHFVIQIGNPETEKWETVEELPLSKSPKGWEIQDGRQSVLLDESTKVEVSAMLHANMAVTILVWQEGKLLLHSGGHYKIRPKSIVGPSLVLHLPSDHDLKMGIYDIDA